MAPYYPPAKLIAPIFVAQDSFNSPSASAPIALRSIPGFSRLNASQAYRKIESLLENGIRSILVYPLLDASTHQGAECNTLPDEHFFLFPFVRQVKQRYPELQVILDLCLCHFGNSGQCGILENHQVVNQLTLEALEVLAVLYASTGTDALMLSGMIDGAVTAVRTRLDRQGHTTMALMVQSSKFDSSLYGPFQLLKSTPIRQALKSSYQLDPANRLEAHREIRLDLEEGADVVVMKPILNSLDLLPRFDPHTRPPIFGYMTGGEYALLRETLAEEPGARLAQLNGWLKNLERAGIDAVFTYIAEEYAHLLSNSGRQKG